MIRSQQPRPKTLDAARNKWRGILASLDIDERSLTGRHSPCPLCGHAKNFRFDNRDGNGSWICTCGAGTGMQLLQRLHDWDFAAAARAVDDILMNGSPTNEAPKPSIDADERKRMLNGMWSAGKPIAAGDPVGSYLASRTLPLPQCRGVLRYVERCWVPNGGGVLPAMVAKVQGPDGKPVTLHRTFLGPNGKADIDEPRALMPGEIPSGSAVRLAPVAERMGIAEGIETALAATRRFNLPCWSALNAPLLMKWAPPTGVRQVVVFGDNDASATGQAAAWALVRDLKRRGFDAQPMIPTTTGTDWADKDAA